MFTAGIDGIFFLLIISMILSITSSAAKKRKQGEQKRKDLHLPDEDWMQTESELENEKQEAGRSFEEVWPKIRMPKENPKQEYRPLAPTVLPQEEGQVSVQTTMSKRHGEAVRRSGKRGAKKVQREDGAINEKVKADDNVETMPNELLGDFDLRKAVIYSEIMSPKYKEY